MLFGRKSAANGKHRPAAPLTHEPAPTGDASKAATNGVKPGSNDAKERVIPAKRTAAAFGEIVTLLMRSGAAKHHALADLEWLVVPALRHGQYVLAEAQSKETGATAPVGAVLWAFVSAAVDARLSDVSAPVRLEPAEWRSGEIPWIITAAGNTKVLPRLMRPLAKTVFKDRPPKMRVRGPDGKLAVGRLEIRDKSPADA